MSDNRTLLIVEDDMGLQRQLRWAYEGHEVVVAGDRAGAIEARSATQAPVAAASSTKQSASSRTPSQRFVVMKAKYARTLPSLAAKYCRVSSGPRRNARSTGSPPSASATRLRQGERETDSSR